MNYRITVTYSVCLDRRTLPNANWITVSLSCSSCIYLQYLHFVILHHKSQNPYLYIPPKFVGSQKSITSHDYFNDCWKPEDSNARVNGMNMEKKMYAIIFHTKRWHLNPVANYIYNLWISCIDNTLFFSFPCYSFWVRLLFSTQ